MLCGRLVLQEEDSMNEGTEHSADERTDTESSLLEHRVAVGDRAEPVDEEGGSAHSPGYDESPARERSSAGSIARRERDPARGEG
jgi:hypothetical protein